MKQIVIFRPIIAYDDFDGAPSFAVGIIKGTKMDPNYSVVDIILPRKVINAVVYRPRITYTSLTLDDMTYFPSLDDFQQAYPEYFI